MTDHPMLFSPPMSPVLGNIDTLPANMMEDA